MNVDQTVRDNARLLSANTKVFLSFPLMVLATYFWPMPATFARQKEHATWSIIIVLLSVFTVITGICIYVWGRLATLSQGVRILSLNRLDPHPFSLLNTGILTLMVPFLILAWAFALHILAHMQQGRGSYRAQAYSVLIIETPLILMLVSTVLLLSVAPTIGEAIRIPFTAISLLLLVYNIFLLLPSLMGVQHLSAKQALLCLLVILTVCLLLVIYSDSSSTHSTSQGSGDRHFKRTKNQHARYCSHCGFSLDVYDQLHETLTQSCPKCGKPLY